MRSRNDPGELIKFGRKFKDLLDYHGVGQSELALQVQGLTRDIVNQMIAGNSLRLTLLNFRRCLKGLVLLEKLTERDEIENWLEDFYTAKGMKYKPLEESPEGREILELLGHIQERSQKDLEIAQEAENFRRKTLYIYRGHSAGIRALAWSPNGRQIATASDDYTAQVWDAFTGQQQVVYRQHSHVEGVAWSSGGKRIVSGCADGTAQIWYATTGEHIYTYTEHIDFYQRHPSAQGHPWVNRVDWSPNGTRIVSCDQFSVDTHTATVRVWNAATGETIVTYSSHRNGVYAVEWSPDGTHIASAGYDRTLQIWEAATGRLIMTHGGSAYLFGLSWSPDGEQIAVGSSDNSVLIVDANNRKVLHICRGHSKWVKDVAWSPNGKYIASGSDDGFVIIWDAITGARLDRYNGQCGHINAVRWSPDGKFIASGGDTVSVWQGEMQDAKLE